MKTAKIPPYIRSSNIDLAKWQTVVFETVKESLSAQNSYDKSNAIHKLAFVDTMTLGTNLHVQRHKNGEEKVGLSFIQNYVATSKSIDNNDPHLQSYLSDYYFNAAKDLKSGKITEITVPPLQFPESDYAYAQWAIAASKWTAYANPESSPYIDWAKTGNDINTFSVVTIPENSKILILGDFGTGLPDGIMMLTSILYNQNPDFIVHLGDIYYSGSPGECTDYVNMFNDAFTAVGKKVPVFTIPGNHDYYSGGGPFFSQVMTMNANNGFSQYNQLASYFSLRTASGNWQFLAMDTGLNSIHVNNATDLVNSYAPWLWFSEAQWHQNKLGNNNFKGKTVLLSHHQVYSASSVINDGKDADYLTGTDTNALKYLNGNLINVFNNYLPNYISAWFWGHEHILGIYEDNQAGLKKGRLIGNSGYEEWEEENPYTVTDSPYQYSNVNNPIKLDTSTVNWKLADFNFYNHGYAMVQLNDAAATVNYYEYPVMSPDAAIIPAASLPKPTQINFTDTL